MKRRSAHTGFALVSSVLAVFAGLQLLSINKAKSTRQAIASVSAETEKPANPSAKLAWANLLSAEGEFQKAESAFNELIRQFKHGSGDGEIARAAQFNLANSYLRKGMTEDLDPAQARQMIELSKQRYRDLLRQTADDWDARYNLERALRLAPEILDTTEPDDEKPQAKRVRVITPDFQIEELP